MQGVPDSVAVQSTAPPTRKPSTRGTTTQPLEAVNLPDALLKVATVGAVTALSASSIFRKTAAGEFPEPVRLGARCTRWRAADVRAWLAAQGASTAAG